MNPGSPSAAVNRRPSTGRTPRTSKSSAPEYVTSTRSVPPSGNVRFRNPCLYVARAWKDCEWSR